jgi:diguanylate cyclase (GGDEF)-like protein
MKILIADNDKPERHRLEVYLRADGHEVDSYADGESTLRALHAPEPPRLAILDWLLPDRLGTEICRYVRRHVTRPHIHLLLLAPNHVSREDLVIAMEAGADDFLAKPFDPQELRARLNSGQRIIELQERLEYFSMHDPQTGALNHGAILEALAREAARAARSNTALSAMLIDLDGLRHVNEKHGYQTGDAVIGEAVRRLAVALRPYDSLGRFGGEEFLVVAPECEAGEAAALAERLRARIGERPFRTDGGEVRVSASVGVATLRGPGLDTDALLRAADGALQRAKQGGHNSVSQDR